MTTEPKTLIDDLWARALAEGQGVSGVGQRMAELAAEECVGACLIWAGDHYVDKCVEAIRERFGLPPA